MRILTFALIYSLIQFIFTLFLPLNNGIYSAAGGYTVTIGLGTPPQPFEVQVDTGSTKLVVRCQNCANCADHPHSHFDPNKSSTSHSITCTDGSFFCDDCTINAMGNSSCILKAGYEDGGWLKGDMVSDIFSLPNGSARMKFGCIEEESMDLALDASTDGIWGVRRGYRHHHKSNTTTFQRYDELMVALSQQSKGGRLFSLCIGRWGGKMHIGNTNSSLHTQPPIFVPYDDPSGDDHIANSLSTIAFGDIILINNGSQQLPYLLIDSGSTNSILSLALYTKIITLITDICKNMTQHCKPFFNPNRTSQICLNLTDASFLSAFPPLSLTFSGVPILWYAEEYLYILQANLTTYCILFVGKKGSFVLGDDFMMNKDIVFGEDGVTIYPQSKCSDEVVTHSYKGSLFLPSLPSKEDFYKSNQTPSKSGEQLVVADRHSSDESIIGIVMVVLLIGIMIGMGMVYMWQKCRRGVQNMVEQDVAIETPVPTGDRLKTLQMQKL